MKEKLSTTILLLALLGAVIFSIVSLHEEELSSADMHQPSSQLNLPYSSTRYTREEVRPLNSEQTLLTDITRGSQLQKVSKPALPIRVKLIGTDLRDTPIALLESSGIAHEYALGELIFKWPIQVLDIQSESIILAHENNTYSISLEGPNLLTEKAQEKSLDFNAMSAEEIGTRPRIIEHIVKLNPTDFIADGMIASIGMNPKLFSQAGLKEDDVIKTVNGHRITVAQELAELQRTIPFTDTLVFEVERKGRMITLFLDIPSESLNITR